MASRIRTFLSFGATIVGCFAFAESCNPGSCGPCPTTLELQLPELDARVSQTVTVELQQVGGSANPISCTWAPTAFVGVSKWTCTKDSNGNTTSYGTSSLDYNVASLEASWTVQLTGPVGSQTVTRAPRNNGSGDGWPTSCACDNYSLTITGDDVQSVGAVTPGSNTAIDAGADSG